MPKLIKIFAVLLSLAGCTAESRAIAVAVAQEAAVQADFNAKAKQWTWCNTLTSGAEHRVYGPYKQKMAARNVICWPDLLNEQPPVSTPGVAVMPLGVEPDQHHVHPSGVPVL